MGIERILSSVSEKKRALLYALLMVSYTTRPNKTY